MLVLMAAFVRYAFRSVEKAALQEIGPRFTLKLRWLKKGIPAVQNLGVPAPALRLATDDAEESQKSKSVVVVPPVTDEYEWQWRVRKRCLRCYRTLTRVSTAGSGDNTADILFVIGFCTSIVNGLRM